VYKCLGCSPSCGRCLAAVRAILNERVREPALTGESCQSRIENAAKSGPTREPDRVAACRASGPREVFALFLGARLCKPTDEFDYLSFSLFVLLPSGIFAQAKASTKLLARDSGRAGARPQQTGSGQWRIFGHANR